MIYNKAVNGITTWYLWDGNKLLAEYTSTGTQQKRYAYLPNKIAPIQMADSTGIYNVHSNHLETPILITNSANQIVWRANHESFGKAVINDDVDGNGNRITFNIRFPGQYYDAESGLHYNRHRYYDAATGRYITSDPIGLLGGLNTYIYARNNPLSRIDPYGLVDAGWFFNGRVQSNISSQLGQRYPFLPESGRDQIAETVRENMTDSQYESLDFPNLLINDPKALADAQKIVEQVIADLRDSKDPKIQDMLDTFDRIKKEEAEGRSCKKP